MIYKILRNNIEIPQEIKLKDTDDIFFICDKCGVKSNKKFVSLKRRNKDLNFILCRNCHSKKTNIEKYGVENPSQNKQIREKTEKTNIKKYGNKAPAMNKEIKEKTKQYFINKFNVENPNQVKHIQEKIKKTNIEKYGSTSFLGSEKKRNLTKKTNYDIFVKRISNNYILNNTFEEYNDMYLVQDKLKIQCKTCGTNFEFLNNYGISRFPRCPICYPVPIGGSFEEDELYEYISSLSKKEIIRNNKKILNGLEIDVFIPELNIGFEYNGLYYHSENSFSKSKYYHLNKQEMAKKEGIQLFFIQSNEWLHKKDIVKSIISSKLGFFNYKIFARKTLIKEVNNLESSTFFEENHIQGNVNSSVKIGLYYNNELISLISLGKNRFGKQYEWELYRYCNKLNTSVVGGFSKMLSYFEKNYNPKSIITYSDKRLFNKNTYAQNGFKQLKDSGPNYYYTKNYNNIESRIKYQKYKLPELFEKFDPKLTEWENMVMNGYDRIWDCGNRVFIKNYT